MCTILITKKKEREIIFFFYSYFSILFGNHLSPHRVWKNLDDIRRHAVSRIKFLVERASIIAPQGGRASSSLHRNSTSSVSIGTTGCHLREFAFTYPSPNLVGLDSGNSEISGDLLGLPRIVTVCLELSCFDLRLR